MKRIIISFVFLYMAINLYADEKILVKIKEYKSSRDDGLYIVDIETDDNDSTDYVNFFDDGEMFIYESCSPKLIFFDENYDIKSHKKIKQWNTRYLIKTFQREILFNDRYGSIYYYNSDLENVFYVRTYEFLRSFSTVNSLRNAYYDKESDVLFFLDKKDKLYSIEHPCLDEKENQKNFLEPEQTIQKLENKEWGEHLGVDEDKDLTVNGRYYRWGDGIYMNDWSCSIISEDNYINIWDGKKRHEGHYTIPDNEMLESSAVHPSGDCYILTIDWEADIHTLYAVQNTWYPEWRTKWYEEHPDAADPFSNN